MALASRPRKPARSPLLAQTVNALKYATWRSFLKPSEWPGQAAGIHREATLIVADSA